MPGMSHVILICMSLCPSAHIGLSHGMHAGKGGCLCLYLRWETNDMIIIRDVIIGGIMSSCNWDNKL